MDVSLCEEATVFFRSLIYQYPNIVCTACWGITKIIYYHKRCLFETVNYLSEQKKVVFCKNW